MYLIKQINYASEEYNKMLEIRNEVLLKSIKPEMKQQFSSLDKQYILLCIYKNETTLIGCCMIDHTKNPEIQLRQMAILPLYQENHAGTCLLNYAENECKKIEGSKIIVLDARKAVLNFYVKNGYEAQGDEYLKVGIPHYRMHKAINK